MNGSELISNVPIILRKLFRRQALVGLIFLTCVILIKCFHLTDYLSLNYVHSNVEHLHGLIAANYFKSVLIFILTYTFASALSLPGSSVFLMAAGLLFGVVPGIIYANIGATIGATTLFLTSRYVIGEWVQRKYGNHLEKFNYEIDRAGTFYLLMVRLIAILPFFMVNLLSGLTLLPTRSFMWVTSLGMIPVSIVFGFAGQELAKVETVEQFFTPSVVFAFAVLFIFKIALVPFVYRHFKKRSSVQVPA